MKKIVTIILGITLAIGSAFAVGCGNDDAAKGGDAAETRTVSYVGNEKIRFDDTDKYIVKNKSSEYKIVVPADASTVVGYAAEELSYFLEKSTACVLPIVTDTEFSGGKFISVGETSEFAASGIKADYATLGENGVTVTTIGDRVYLCGATDYGTLFSVYKFLHFEVGYEAYAYDHTEYDYHTSLKLKNFDYSYKPALGTMNAEDGEMSGEDKVKQALRMGIYASQNGGYDMSGNLFNGLWCHTTAYLAPPSRYGDLWNNGQLCYSKEKTVEVVSQSLIGRYVNAATGPYLMIGGEDNVGSCDCADCKKGAEQYGGAAGVYVRFLNKVAKNVEDYMVANGMTKRLTIVGLFYYAYIQPPVKLVDGNYVAVDESVIPVSGQVSVGVMYTPIQSCYTHAWGDDTCKQNALYVDYIKGWAAITDHLMTYSYGTNFQALKFHFNNWSYIGDTFRFLSDLGLTYYFEQACAFNDISPMSSMRVYVRAKLAWNPYYDTQDLIDEFISHYYGAGADGVSEYFAAVMENFERIYTLTETECEGIYYAIAKSEYWTRQIIKDYESYLEKAMIAAEKSGLKGETYKERIFREYYLVKETEQLYYSKFLSDKEREELNALIEYGREKYNVTRGAE